MAATTNATLLSPPFGPFNAVREHVVRNAAPLNPLRFLFFFATPCAVIYYQALLLVSPGARKNRGKRAAMGVLGLAVMLNSWTSYRFVSPTLNAFNNGFTIVFLHLALKFIEFGLLTERVHDPYMALGRSRHVAAVDLCINSRLVSLGSVGLDTLAGPPNASLPKHPHVERHLRHKRRKRHPRPTTRWGSVARHARHAFTHYVVVDTLLALLSLVGPDTLGVPQGTRNVLDKFIASTKITVLPGILDWVLPAGGVRFSTELCVPLVIWQSLSCGYHCLALACVGSGFWEVQSWDVDLFDAPWRADSIIDLWGKRWHQMFRHQFIILSVTLTRALGVKIGSHALFLLTFVFSGLLHAFGELSMDPLPEPWKLGTFFVLAGLGCAIEVSFKRATGHRVKGLLGRIWTWTFMYFAGGLATNAWLDGGIAGCTLLPTGGVGSYTAPLMIMPYLNLISKSPA